MALKETVVRRGSSNVGIAWLSLVLLLVSGIVYFVTYYDEDLARRNDPKPIVPAGAIPIYIGVTTEVTIPDARYQIKPVSQGRDGSIYYMNVVVIRNEYTLNVPVTQTMQVGAVQIDARGWIELPQGVSREVRHRLEMQNGDERSLVRGPGKAVVHLHRVAPDLEVSVTVKGIGGEKQDFKLVNKASTTQTEGPYSGLLFQNKGGVLVVSFGTDWLYEE